MCSRRALIHSNNDLRNWDFSVFWMCVCEYLALYDWGNPVRKQESQGTKASLPLGLDSRRLSRMEFLGSTASTLWTLGHRVWRAASSQLFQLLSSAPGVNLLSSHRVPSQLRSHTHQAVLSAIVRWPGNDLSFVSSPASLFAVYVCLSGMKFVFQALTDWQGKQGCHFCFVLFFFMSVAIFSPLQTIPRLGGYNLGCHVHRHIFSLYCGWGKALQQGGGRQTDMDGLSAVEGPSSCQNQKRKMGFYKVFWKINFEECAYVCLDICMCNKYTNKHHISHTFISRLYAQALAISFS